MILNHILQMIKCRIREHDATQYCIRCDDCGRCKYHGKPCIMAARRVIQSIGKLGTCIREGRVLDPAHYAMLREEDTYAVIWSCDHRHPDIQAALLCATTEKQRHQIVEER